jgi:hypothetical protein
VHEKVIEGLKISAGINLNVLSLLSPIVIEKKVTKKTTRQRYVYSNRDILSLLLQCYCFTDLNSNIVP